MRKSFTTKLLLLLSLSLSAFAQDRTITGKVISTDDGAPLPGVSVQLAGSSRGTTTDSEGSYRISVPNDNTHLVFRFIGYLTQEVSVGNRSTIDIRLTNSSKDLNEVVVVAYGQQQRKSITGSITQVQSQQLANRPFTSVAQSLQGTVAGLQSTSPSGQPGGLQQIRIRGIGSISASAAPLFVIDGIPVNSGDFSRITTTASTLAGLNPNDIENVSVLKDASATSIYGSRAANGVILITTKKGKGGKTKISFDTEIGYNDLTLSDNNRPLNRAEYLELTREGLANSTLTQAQKDAALEAVGANNNNDTDWFSLVNRRGQQRQYNLSLSGGDNKTTFYLSGGYFKQQATTIGSEFRRISGQLNVTHNANQYVSFFSTMNVSNSDQKAPPDGGAFANPIYAAMSLLPTQTPYNPDGSLNISQTDFPSMYNPLALIALDKRQYSSLKGLGSVGATLRPLPNLNLTSRFGIDYNGLEENRYSNPTHGDGRTNNGQGFAYYTRLFNWNWSNIADYRLHFNADRTFYTDVKLGYEAQKSKMYAISAFATGFPPTTDLTLPIVAATPRTASAFGSDYTFASFFANASFNYKDRYILSGSLRRDGSSLFGSNNRYGTFWSAGVAWNIDEEPFFKAMQVLSSLKLRASYGVNGNADLSNLTNSNYIWRATYGYGYNYNQQPGSAPNSIGNIDLTWELNKPFNVGTDFGLLDNRIQITADYYVRTTSNLLQNVPLSRTTGFSSILSNIGSMENRGFELTINANPIKSAFQWNLNFNIAFNKNKIKSLNQGLEILSGAFIRRVGYDYQSYYMPIWAGVDSETGDPQWYKDIKHLELTNEYKEANANQQIVGSASPKGFGGFSNTFAYKGLSLEFQINFQYGNYVYDRWGNYLLSDGYSPIDNKYKRQLNRWQKPGDNSENPKYIYNNSTNSSKTSTRYLYKGDFARLRNITLGYSLPSHVLRRIGLSKVFIYARGTNLLTKTSDKRLTFDPETSIDGMDNQTVPIVKTVTFGLNLGLN